jgi:hypothetical protein
MSARAAIWAKLERDIAAADEQHPPRRVLKLKEVVAGGHQLRTGNAERARLHTRGDDDVAAAQFVALNRDAISINKACGAVEGGDALLGKALLALLGTGSVKLRLCACRPGQSICSPSGATPRPCMRRAASTISGPRLSIFLGSQPRRA